MDELTIGEVARRVGLRPSAIRYYESAGILPPPRRLNGRRRYSAAVLDQLALIRFAQQAGFTVAEMQVLLHGFPAETTAAERWQTLARRKLADLETLLAQVQTTQRLL